MDLSPLGPETAALIAGAGFACAGLWMLLGQRRASGLAVALAGAGLLALAVLRGGGPAPEAASEPEPVAVVDGGVTLSPDGLRTVATPAPPPPPPPLPGRPAAQITIEAAEAEPNDNLAIANRGEPGTAIVGALAGGDLDYFGFDMPERPRGEIVANLVVLKGDASITLFDDAGQGLGTAETHATLSVRAASLVRKLDRPRFHVLVLATSEAEVAYQLTLAVRPR